MTDFQVRSDNVDVEQIMRQIRSRIREKRGVDYTEDEIRAFARICWPSSAARRENRTPIRTTRSKTLRFSTRTAGSSASSGGCCSRS